MHDLFEQMTNGHVTEVKIVLTSVVTALALYQVALMTVGYGRVRLPFLKGRVASTAHRTIGDVIAPITALVGLMCLGYFGISEGIDHARDGQEGVVTLHVVAGFALAAALTCKIVIVRWWHSRSGLLPYLGVAVLGLFLATWVTSAGAYL
jgi:Family of unknown function (DUF6529)